MYIIKKLGARTRQCALSLEDLLNGIYEEYKVENPDREELKTSTITRIIEEPDDHMYAEKANVYNNLKMFYDNNKVLFDAPRERLYRHYSIPKRNGGMRPIDDPCYELRVALKTLKDILNAWSVTYHTAAYAYIEGRSTICAVKKLMSINPNNFLHLDFHGFFPNTTKEFCFSQIEQVYPWAVWCRDEQFKEMFEKTLSLAFLNNGLPQGTEISPMITNLMMVPFDHYMNKLAREANMVYIRYADDIYISSYGVINKDFWTQNVKSWIRRNNCSFTLNEEKTHEMRIGAPVVILGVHISAEKKMTAGSENGRMMKAALNNFLFGIKNGAEYSAEDVMELQGLFSYYRQIENEKFSNMLQKIENKYSLSFKNECKRIINGG